MFCNIAEKILTLQYYEYLSASKRLLDSIKLLATFTGNCGPSYFSIFILFMYFFSNFSAG